MNSPSIWSRWWIVLMLMGYAGLAHFNRVAISVAGSEVFIREDGISATDMGWVYTSFLLVYTLGMLPGGWLIDRIGAARALALLGLTMGTFVALTGTLGWLTSTPAQLWLGLIVIRSISGLWNAPLHPGAAHVVSDVMKGPGRATANGMVTAGALIGIACCYPIFGMLIDRLTWPWAFAVSGATLVGYGAVWHLFVSRLLPNRAGTAPEAPSSPRFTELPKPSMVDWTLFRHGNLWLIALSYAAFGYFQYLFMYWMTYYFEKILIVPDVDSRRALFYIMLAQAAGMAVGGLSTDGICRLLGTTWGRRSIVITGMGLSAVFGLIAVSVSAQSQVVAALAISMGALGMCEGVFWTTATDIGGKSRGLAGAFMNTCGNVGGLISPVLTPALAESMGWPGAIAVACVVSGLGGLVWFWITPPSSPSSTSGSISHKE